LLTMKRKGGVGVSVWRLVRLDKKKKEGEKY